MAWQMPTADQWLLLLAIALCSIAMHFTMVKAYSLAPVVTLMPFDFMRLVYTALLAYVFFGETSDAMTWIGSAIIVGSVAVMAKRDTKATTQARTSGKLPAE
jgi:S-adenosylmethionine uptake transporter